MNRLRLLATLILMLVAFRPAGADRIVAIGDVHGEIAGFTEILTAAGLLGEDGQWAGGSGTLVQTGDLTDRGPRVRAVLDLMMALEQQAPEDGGKVVALLGNHEIWNLTGYFDFESTPREVFNEIWSDFADDDSKRRHKRALVKWLRWQRDYPECGTSSRASWMAQRPLGYLEYVEALSPEGKYGRWLRSLPVAAAIGDSIFLHGGLSPELLERGISSLDELNARARRELAQFDEDRARLVREGVILPFANLGETYCAVQKELAKLGRARGQDTARRDELQAIRDRLPGTSGWLLFDPEGPVWFRGLASYQSGADDERLDKVLKAFDAQRIVVGHTPSPGKIQRRMGGRVYLIDTAMAYGPAIGGKGAALELEGDRAVAIYRDSRVVLAGEPAAADSLANSARHPVAAPTAAACQGCDLPAAAARAPFVGPDSLSSHAAQPADEAATAAVKDGAGQMPDDRPIWLDADGEPLPFQSDAGIADFLTQATILESKDVGSGVTRPKLLLLERNGVRAHAIYHDIKIELDRQRLAGGKVVMFFRDSYINNVAAYKLSRLLWIQNVPPAVLRKLDHKEGSVQLWVENAKTEEVRRAANFTPPGNWRLAWDDMWVFDNLMNNIDRNQGNILYDSNWRLLYIDHTRAFGRDKKLPDQDRIKRCSRRLWRRLQEVGDQRLKSELKPYLGTYEIAAVLARRTKLLKLINQLINSKGEASVLRSYSDAVDSDEADPEVAAAPEG